MPAMLAAFRGKGCGGPALPSPRPAWGATNLPPECRKLLADVAGSGQKDASFRREQRLFRKCQPWFFPYSQEYRGICHFIGSDYGMDDEGSCCLLLNLNTLLSCTADCYFTSVLANNLKIANL